jgi:uncharacterized protein (TIGR03086 family)
MTMRTGGETGGPPRPAPSGGAARLEQAVRYALAAASAAAPDLLPLPTPCRDWDLRMLLLHAGESLAALAEGFTGGRISLLPGADGPEPDGDPGRPLRERGRELLTACRTAAGAGDRLIAVEDCPMAMSTLIATGALEIAVHGWDISRACGHDQPIPEQLALDLLPFASLLVGPADRGYLFAEPVAVPAAASASDRLAAFLGRQPAR